MKLNHLEVKKPSKASVVQIETVDQSNQEKLEKMGFIVDKTGKYPVLKLTETVDKAYCILKYKYSFDIKKGKLYNFDLGLETLGLFEGDLKVSPKDLKANKEYLTVLDRSRGRPSVLAEIKK